MERTWSNFGTFTQSYNPFIWCVAEGQRLCVGGGVMSVAGVNPSSHLVTVHTHIHTHVHTYSQFTSFFFLSFHLVSFSPLSYGPSLSPSLIIPSLLHSPPHVLLPVLASLLFPPLLALPPSFLCFSQSTRGSTWPDARTEADGGGGERETEASDWTKVGQAGPLMWPSIPALCECVCGC